MAYDIYSVKVKKVGEVEFETTIIDSFLGTNEELTNNLEKFMGNNDDFSEEYVIIDEEYSFIENAGKDVDHMQELYKFIDASNIKSYGKIDGVEISTSYINIPSGSDLNQYNCIITNSDGYYNLLVKQDDAAEIATGMFLATAASLEKATNSASKKSIKESLETLDEGDLDLKDDDVDSLESLKEIEDDIDNDIDDLDSMR